jgi:hypothetical protein
VRQAAVTAATITIARFLRTWKSPVLWALKSERRY